jgi:phosphoenolpyruvate synthase/pyruvate phosphate dikinase
VTYTVRLDEVSKDDIALAGGKGSNLGELSRAGLPVPPGYVVITRAYDAFVESNNIGDVIVGHASVALAEDPAGFEEVAGGSARFSPAATFPRRWLRRYVPPTTSWAKTHRRQWPSVPRPLQRI